MPTEQIMRQCENCARPTLHLESRPNHIVHLLLSLVTAGLWIFVWLLACADRKQSCTVCGRTKTKRSKVIYTLALAVAGMILFGVIAAAIKRL